MKWAVSDREEALAKEVTQANVIVAEYAPITRKVINSAPLRMIIAYGVGYNHIDVDAASEKGVFVTNFRGSNSEAVAELTVCMMLALLRNLRECDQHIRNKRWKNVESGKLPDWMIGTELYGKTLGIVGIGEIGKRVARICGKGFSMRILATDPFVTREQAQEIGAELIDLESLLRSSDIVTVHVPLSAETRCLIGAKEIGLMKKSACLINTSRGFVADEAALIQALKERKIAAAGLDVFQKEPISTDNPLLGLDNTVLSPHIAGSTRESFEAYERILLEEVTRVARGELPKNLVNRSQLAARGHLRPDN